MIDKHLFTVHHTYTGKGCAMCGRAPCEHESFDWLINGERTIDPLERDNAFQSTSVTNASYLKLVTPLVTKVPLTLG